MNHKEMMAQYRANNEASEKARKAEQIKALAEQTKAQKAEQAKAKAAEAKG